MPPLQWTVVEAELDPVRGSEQHGRRPVLVVSEEAFNQAMPNVTVLPFTTTARSLYPSEATLPANAAGQPRDSIVMAHQIRTISKQRLGRVYGHLVDASLREAVRTALLEHLGLDES